LLVAAGYAAPETSTSGKVTGQQDVRRGGTLRVDLRSDWGVVDPTLAYNTTTWQLLNATQLKLMGFPDRAGSAGTRLVPEAAAAFPRISKDGRTYSFRIRSGFRFSDGKPVTARNFAYAFTRALSPKMQSPAAAFLSDVARYRASGQVLTVTLKRPAPDFLARLTTPFFSALPLSLPLDADGVGAPLVSAGPYVLKEWTPQRTALVVRNPYWQRDRQPWKSLGRPANVDRMVFEVGNSLDATRLRLERGDVDLGGIAPAAASELAEKYGINKGRFHVAPTLLTFYLALNNEQPLFRNNPALRRAVNHALDRQHLVRQHGFLAGSRTDQILPPGMPGYRDANLYSLKAPNLAVAKRLASGRTRGGKARMYTFNFAPGPQVAQVVQFNLKQIGLDVEIETYDRGVQYAKMGTRGEKFDLGLDAWSADYADPSNFLNVLLDGTRISKENNTNVSYFDNRGVNRRLAKAASLFGPSRLDAYAALDRQIMREHAPLAPYVNMSAKAFTSAGLGCFTHSNVYGTTNLVAVCKK
jgi:ABC-type transport system substrate-binding protein